VKKLLGVDVGGTNVRAAVVGEEGKLLAVAKRRLADRGPDAVVAAVVQAVDEVEKSGGRGSACGVGFAGQLDGESGLVRVAPNLGWRDVPLGELLQQRLARPVSVVNDLSAAAWGEHRAGASKGVNDAFTVFVGSGVGSAIIANGSLVHGARGVAGEFGHVKVVPGGRLCGCGEQGCLEAYAGGHNLTALMEEAIAAKRSPGLEALTQGTAPTPVHLEEAAAAGDSAAVEIFDRAVEFLGVSLGNQITVLNPGVVVLGGGVLAHAPGLRERVKARALEICSRTSRAAVTIRDAALGDDSGLIGAALLSMPA
jgi:glucokinase